MTILLTGAAGFIGMHVVEALLARGERVIGIDSLTPYYDLHLKHARRDRLLAHAQFSFAAVNIADRTEITEVFNRHRDVTRIIHLAAQPGVRHSLVDPYSYVEANVMGHLVMLEAARALPRLDHFLYASSLNPLTMHILFYSHSPYPYNFYFSYSKRTCGTCHF